MSATDLETLTTLQTTLVAWQALILQNNMLKLNSQPWPALLGGTINWNINNVIDELEPEKKFAEQLATSAVTQLAMGALSALFDAIAGESTDGASTVAKEGVTVQQDVNDLSTVEREAAQTGVWARIVKCYDDAADELDEIATAVGQVLSAIGSAVGKVGSAVGTAVAPVIKAVQSGSPLLAKALATAMVKFAPKRAIRELLTLTLQAIVGMEESAQSAVAFSGGTGLFTLQMQVTSTQMAASATVGTSTIVNGKTTENSFVLEGEASSLNTVVGGSESKTVGLDTNSGGTTGNTLTVYLGDPDEGDLFNVVIRQDTTFGSPVYVTMSGQSRCPVEAGTLARENPNIQWQSSSAFVALNPYEVATAVLVITSSSDTQETFQYDLNLDTTTNVGGLLVTANGVQLGGSTGATVSVPYGGVGTLVLISFQRQVGTGYSFPGLSFTLTTAGTCGEPLVSTFGWSVSYAQPCSQVAWSGEFAYANTFTVNLASVTQSDGSVPAVKYAVLSIMNPEMSLVNRSWIAMYQQGLLAQGTPGTQSGPFLAEFLPAGASAAQWEILTGDAALDSGSTVFNPLTVSQPGNDYYTWAADVSAFNGYYQFRITTQCVPPVNGAGADASLYSYTSSTLTGLIDFDPPTVYGSAIPAAGTTWTPGAPISVTYDETISCSSLLFGVSAFAAPTLALLVAGQQLTPVAVSGSCLGGTVNVALTGATNWTALSGAFMAVAVEGITDVAGNSPAVSAPYSWYFPVASYDAQHSTVDLSGLAFFPNAATLLAQVEAARATYNATSGSNRRLLQLGGGILPPTTEQVSLQSQLAAEVVSAINLYMSTNQLGQSGLTQQSVVVTALTPASVVASMTFQYTPKATPTSITPVTAITAASYFSEALTSPVILLELANCTTFPMLCQSVAVSNALNGTATASGAQATQFAISAINVRPNAQVLAGEPAISAINISTTTYSMVIDFALQSANVAQMTFQLQMQMAYGTGYDQIDSLLLSYQVVPDPAADPDIIAETSYPLVVVNSSDSTTALSVANELGGEYYVALLSIPTQAGGLNYTISLTDWQRTSTPFFSQQLFVVGPPAPPVLLQVCQVSLQTVQLAYLPSQANGQTTTKGNVNMTYQPTISLYANGSTMALTVSVPPAATTSAPAASWCMSNVTIPCSEGRCAPATAYMNVDLTQLPSLAAELVAPGTSEQWNFSLSAQNSIALTSSAASSYGSNPLNVFSVPAMVRPSKVLQLSLDVLQLTFVMPISNGAPLTGWQVGWMRQNSTTLYTDPAAGASIVTPATTAQSSAAVNSTLNLTIPYLLSGPVRAPFYVSIQAINAYGISPQHLHMVQRPAFVTPPTALSIAPVVAATQSSTAAVYVTAANVSSQSQTVVVTYAAPLPADYFPSSTMAMGFQVTVNETQTVGGANSSTVSVSSVTTFVTRNTSLTLTWPLFAATNISVSVLMNSTNNPAKLCTPGAVAVIASVPAQTSLSTAAPMVPILVTVSQSLATLYMAWPGVPGASGSAFRGWFAPAGTDRDQTAFTSTNQTLTPSKGVI